MPHILKQRIEERESAFVPVSVLDRLYGTELQHGLTSGFSVRQTGSLMFFSLERKMFFDLRPPSLFVPLRRRPGTEPPEESPECSHFRSSAFSAKNRPTMAA